MSSVKDSGAVTTREFDPADEPRYLGLAMLAAQKLEFAFYGMASHLNDKKGQFKKLTPESFLRGNASETKATLGALVREFGDRFKLGGDDLSELVDDRNLIAHDYWRMSRPRVRGGRVLDDPITFLINFTERCQDWTLVCEGWVALAMIAAAEMSGRTDELESTPEKTRKIHHYLERAGFDLKN